MKDKHVTKIENRLKKLEKFAKEITQYMENWGPEVQKNGQSINNSRQT